MFINLLALNINVKLHVIITVNEYVHVQGMRLCRESEIHLLG